MFTIVIFDGDQNIQATFYNDMVDTYYNTLKVDGVYSISDAIIKQAGKFNLT